MIVIIDSNDTARIIRKTKQGGFEGKKNGVDDGIRTRDILSHSQTL